MKTKLPPGLSTAHLRDIAYLAGRCAATDDFVMIRGSAIRCDPAALQEWLNNIAEEIENK